MALPTRFAWLGVLALALSTGACAQVDLKSALEVTDVHTGYYDSGNLKGSIHLEPSITFRLHNKSGSSVGGVQMMVSFWKAGGDGEWDSALVKGISGSLAAGASTDPIVVRGTVGFNLEGPRADFFSHSLFVDVTAKVFASQAGVIVPMGEYKLDHEIFAHDLIEK